MAKDAKNIVEIRKVSYDIRMGKRKLSVMQGS